MGERKGVNKYYPPDWTPAMGSLNKYHGTHALRERARKLDRGILIIRFEMPYNIWCDGCKNHIGMGVRYNAEKTKVGMYYTTPIYQFRFKCHLCDNHIEMKTDPQNLDYVVVSGAQRQERRWDPTQNGQVVPEDKATSAKLATDAMYKLEHGVNDQRKSNSQAPSLANIEDRQDVLWRDDYAANKILRNRFRAKKNDITKQKEIDGRLLAKSSLAISLVPEHPQDVRLAGLLRLTPLQSFEDAQRSKRDEIQNGSIFQNKSSRETTTTTTIATITNGALKTLVKTVQNSKVEQSYKDIGAAITSTKLAITPKSKSTNVELVNESRTIGNNVYSLVSSYGDGTSSSASSTPSSDAEETQCIHSEHEHNNSK